MQFILLVMSCKNVYLSDSGAPYQSQPFKPYTLCIKPQPLPLYFLNLRVHFSRSVSCVSSISERLVKTSPESIDTSAVFVQEWMKLRWVIPRISFLIKREDKVEWWTTLEKYPEIYTQKAHLKSRKKMTGIGGAPTNQRKFMGGTRIKVKPDLKIHPVVIWLSVFALWWVQVEPTKLVFTYIWKMIRIDWPFTRMRSSVPLSTCKLNVLWFGNGLSAQQFFGFGTDDRIHWNMCMDNACRG